MLPNIFSFFLAIYAAGAFVSFLLGFRQTYRHKNPYGLTPWLLPYGIFVWGDAVILGLFWTLISVVSLLWHNASFFALMQSLYWMVRSSGEVMYWFLQQFASVKRDLPHTLWGQALFPGESIWFAYQLVWQIVLVLSIASTLFLLGIFS